MAAPTINTYLSDMLALEQHHLQPLSRRHRMESSQSFLLRKRALIQPYRWFSLILTR